MDFDRKDNSPWEGDICGTGTVAIYSLSQYDYHNWHICLSSTPRNSQASFKLGMSYEPPCFVEESDQAEINSGACVILNTTAIRDKFQLINKRFNLLFAKRAFVHWYVGQGRVKFGDD